MQEISILNLAISLASGLALFLYGMKLMSEGLESVAGSKMKRIVELFTSNPIVGVFVGAFVTAIIQSSSATTVMVIGFVNAGIMNLTQAVSIIMGANIGTTITGQMVSFRLDALAPVAIVVGVFLLMAFASNRKQKYGYVILGFGLLFMGMGIMGDSMAPLKELQMFRDLIIALSSPGIGNILLGVLIGTAITAVIQSSSAVTAIIVAMASEGTITIDAAFPLILGANIGTTVTAMLSSVGANKMAIKAGLIHTLFNVVGSLIFVVLFILFREQSLTLMYAMGANAARQIANVHTVFNLVNTVLLFPFRNQLVCLVNKLIPGEESRGFSIRLDERMIETPAFAIQMVKTEIERMGEITMDSYDAAIKGYIEQSEKAAREVFEYEKQINEFESTIAGFLVKLSNAPITSDQRSFLDNMINVINDIERVGDHADNIAELAIHNIENDIYTSPMAYEQIKEMGDNVRKSIYQAFKALAEDDHALAEKVIEREGRIDNFEKVLRKEHIKRLSDGLCRPVAGVVFLDILSNLERIGDHASNIALYVLDLAEEA